MELLVLGGTRFVGRAVIADALDRGWQVSALHRGVTGSLPDGVEALLADRTDADAVTGRQWDLVVDTWSGAPRVATLAARVLAGRVDRYGYVSSASVYEWGRHVDESSPLVTADSGAENGEYPALKRGAELGILTASRKRYLRGPASSSGHMRTSVDCRGGCSGSHAAAVSSRRGGLDDHCSMSTRAIWPDGCCPRWRAISTDRSM